MPTPDDRRRIIKTTGLCLHPDCTAHDKVIEAILRLEKEAYDRGRDDAIEGYDFRTLLQGITL